MFVDCLSSQFQRLINMFCLVDEELHHKAIVCYSLGTAGSGSTDQKSVLPVSVTLFAQLQLGQNQRYRRTSRVSVTLLICTAGSGPAVPAHVLLVSVTLFAQLDQNQLYQHTYYWFLLLSLHSWVRTSCTGTRIAGFCYSLCTAGSGSAVPAHVLLVYCSDVHTAATGAAGGVQHLPHHSRAQVSL